MINLIAIECCHSPKEKLSIEITDIDRVHVDNVNILESSQRQIG